MSQHEFSAGHNPDNMLSIAIVDESSGSWRLCGLGRRMPELNLG